MKDYLNQKGAACGYINLGGNVLCLGAKPDGSSYNIGIQRPFDEEGAAMLAVSVTDQTVVSSGVYERYFEVDGKRYHHILDTATGYPYDNGLLGVSIITDESVDGDGLSDHLFCTGFQLTGWRLWKVWIIQKPFLLRRIMNCILVREWD